MAKRTDKPLLEVKRLSKEFGGLRAVDDVTFSIWPGELLSVIGPNGAGKTTLLNLIAGVFPPSRGEIRFKGRNLRGLRPHQVCSLGIARTFQERSLFTNLTVVENVMVALERRTGPRAIEIMAGSARARKDEPETFERAKEKLALVGLEKKAHSHPLTLSVREQQLLAMVRALATGPELLLLDEPAGGLSIAEIYDVANFILGLRSGGMSILFIEHRMEMVMGFSERVMVLNFGRKIAEDVPAGIQNNREVIEAYLGKGLA